MSTSTVKYLGNLRTEAQHTQSGQKFSTDAPIDNNGKGELFSPTDLAATSLASCAITIMGIKANNLAIELGNIHADIYKIMASNPRRIAEVKIDFKIPGTYSDEEKKSIEIAGRNCPVAKSLHPDLKQSMRFIWLDK